MFNSFKLLAVVLGLLFGSFSGDWAMAHDVTTDGIMIHHPWARASAGHAKTGAAYMEIMVTGDSADRLVAIETGVADRAEIHAHAAVDGVMKMMKLDGADVSPGEPAIFKPGGLHVMLFGLKAPLKEGESFPMTLIFEKAGRVDVIVAVEPIGTTGGSHDMHQGHGS
ncbi:MAG: copper chaperone PCu(A)C [Rhodospirillales bacterium]